MSRSRPVLAIVIALALIGTAGWIRVAQSRTPSFALESIDTPINRDIDPTTPEEVWGSANASTSTKLNQTDLIGRQLFSDYVELATKGQTTPEGLSALADSYAESIVNLPPAAVITVSNVTTTLDSAENLRIYFSKVSGIRARYQNLAESAAKKSKVTSATVESFADFAVVAEKLYEDAAKEFQATPVPSSLKDTHLALINNYLASASNMRLIALASENPVQAYSALIAQSKISEEEINLFSSIKNSLSLSGIILSSDGI